MPTARMMALFGLFAVFSFSGPIANAQDAAAGRALAGQCRACHGLDGIATIPIAPNIAGDSQIYLEKQLKAFRSGARENEMMSVVTGNLSDKDISDLSAWYASIEVTATIPEE